MTTIFDLKQQVIKDLTAKKYTRLMGNHFEQKKDFFEIAELFELGRAEIFTVEEYKAEIETLIQELEIIGDFEGIEEAKNDLKEIEDKEIIIVAN